MFIYKILYTHIYTCDHHPRMTYPVLGLEVTTVDRLRDVSIVFPRPKLSPRPFEQSGLVRDVMIHTAEGGG